MEYLDTRSNRVTLKMDVSYTDHSHVIGKGGEADRHGHIQARHLMDGLVMNLSFCLKDQLSSEWRKSSPLMHNHKNVHVGYVVVFQSVFFLGHTVYSRSIFT